MQKRRGYNKNNNTSSAGGLLPLTEGDVLAKAAANGGVSQQPGRRRRRRKIAKGRSISPLGWCCLIVLIATLYLGGRSFLGGGTSDGAGPDNDASQRRVEEQVEAEPLPLSQFPSLQYALDHSQLVGLYFAAAWCPMSTPVSNMIDEFLADSLLPPPPGSEEEEYHQENNNSSNDLAPMSLVYVSSDRSEDAFLKYHRRNWMSVPFTTTTNNNNNNNEDGSEDKDDERTAIKRHFSVCARPEVTSLGIDRKFEIPTLIILDGQTRGILTTNGAEDLAEFKENALDHWLQLHDLVRAMEDKYYNGDEGDEGSAATIHDKKKKKNNNHNAESLSSLFQ